MTPDKRSETALARAARLPALLVAALSLMIGLLTYQDHVSYAISDPHLSLLVSQAIIEHGTVRLDAYQEAAEPPFATYPESGALAQRNGHYYYFHPIGSSVLAVPYVAVVRALGYDMAILADNHLAQDVLSAILCALAAPLVYALCRCFMGPWSSLAIAAISTLGSALVSTMGTALWSIDFTTLFVLLTLWLLARHEAGLAPTPRPVWLGICLFGAYFCRASAAGFVLVVLLYLFWRSRRHFWPAATVALFLLLLFLGYSTYEHSSPFPQYYSVDRLATHTAIPLWVAFYAHLLSPSRGVLIFSPMFAVAILAALAQLKRLAKQPLFWLSVVWFGAHLVISSRGARWWGGHSFGPRILTEAIPALILLTTLSWRELQRHARPGARWLAAAAYILLGAWAIYVNTYLGLFDVNTAHWNGAIMPPDVDNHPEYLFDWEMPQFLANREDLCTRNLDYMRDGLEMDRQQVGLYQLGSQISYDSDPDGIRGADREAYLEGFRPASILRSLVELASKQPEARLYFPMMMQATRQPAYPGAKNAVFAGWSGRESGYRWSQCETPHILFRLGEEDLDRAYQLEIASGAFGEQEVTVLVNGIEIGRASFAGGTISPTMRTLAFDGRLLRRNEVNEIAFHIPGAAAANPEDPRLLGLAFAWLRLAPQD